MDSFQRGRSPSARDIRQLNPPAVQQAFDFQTNSDLNNNNTGNNGSLTLDPALLDNNVFADSYNTQLELLDSSSFLAPNHSRLQSPLDLLNHNLIEAQDRHQPSPFTLSTEQEATDTPSSFLGSNGDYANLEELSAQFTCDEDQSFDPSRSLDPSLLGSQPDNNIDSNLNLNHNLSADMATMHQQQSQAPHLLHPRDRNHSVSSVLSQHSFYEDPLTSAFHSRNTSLDPLSAAYPQNRHRAGSSFVGHRQPGSDQHSDISSSSARPSPILGTQETFDGMCDPSSLFNGTDDHQYLVANINNFTLCDQQLQTQHFTPGHSPHISPYLGPQQTAPFPGQECFGQLAMNANQFDRNMNMNGYGQEAFPSITPPDANDYSANLSPPEIKFELAPPTRQTTFNQPNGSGDTDALFPPTQTSRVRPRAISDTSYASSLSRGTSPLRSRSPSVGGLQPSVSLSGKHRSHSPGAPAGVSKGARRSSSPAIPGNRDYMLNIAIRQATEQSVSPPDEGSPVPTTGSNCNAQKRGQKHPSTFHCSLCDKSFTRAYNLRSHRRTHTDERPFVCTVCGKAFARQHDRKRHESLHSGEKRFVCRGSLGVGIQWGCGRGFARADALGRHFRSEAGRACIKPLLDEEARERQSAMLDQANFDMMNQQTGGQQAGGLQQAMPQGAPVDIGSNFLPAALLQLYPALAEIQWNTLPATIGEAGEGELSGWEGDSDYEHSGRNSFDGSSAGDFYEEDSNGNAGGMQMGDANGGMGTRFPVWQHSSDGTDLEIEGMGGSSWRLA